MIRPIIAAILIFGFLFSMAQAQESKVTFSLTVAQTNYILTVLSERPYKESAEVLTLIRQQAEASLKPKPEPKPDSN